MKRREDKVEIILHHLTRHYHEPFLESILPRLPFLQKSFVLPYPLSKIYNRVFEARAEGKDASCNYFSPLVCYTFFSDGILGYM